MLRASRCLLGCFSLQEDGLLTKSADKQVNPAAAMFSDPNAMMEMMKKNLSMIVPQVGRPRMP